MLYVKFPRYRGSLNNAFDCTRTLRTRRQVTGIKPACAGLVLPFNT